MCFSQDCNAEVFPSLLGTWLRQVSGEGFSEPGKYFSDTRATLAPNIWEKEGGCRQQKLSPSSHTVPVQPYLC